MSRTIVVGLDGASWDLLEPWLDDGHLPNLEAIRSEGSWATSRSCYPPVTFPNWKCYSSGKNPGKFGVFWFERIDLDRGELEVMNGSSFDTVELWDYLEDAGYDAGVINMPTMFPPRDVGELVVAGGPDAVDGEYRSIESGYTNPPELAAELHERYDYRVHPDPLLSSNEERGAEVDEILELFDQRFQVALDALEERDLDFVHVTLFYLNVLHHFFWDDEPTLRAWQLVDEWLGRIDDLKDTNLIVMSDHGAIETTTEFYINEWLAAHGYQTHERSVEDYLQRLGLTRENALALAKKANLVDLLAQAIPERIQQLVPQDGGVKRERKLEKIDLDRTQAVASGQGPIYIDPDCDIESVREQLITDLESVTDEHDDPLFEAVHRAEDVYSGKYLDGGPDVVLEQRPGVHVNDGIGGGTVMTEPDRWAAENTMTGIFVANGPDFEASGHLNEISITDIAPTVLATFDIPTPTDMDGETIPVVHDGLGDGEREPLAHIGETGAASNEVADRLKQLGYME